MSDQEPHKARLLQDLDAHMLTTKLKAVLPETIFQVLELKYSY
jgi:hypothetical protein